jgi:plasmid stabilization system protein ParE
VKRWYHPEFERELIAAARYLEQRRSGFGSLFLGEVESAIDLIGRNPNAARAWHRDTRRHVLQRFRYTIRYRVRTDQDTIDFLSIVHTSRHPSTGLDR